MIKSSVVAVISMFLFLIVSGYVLAGDYQLPDTGINKCYNNDVEIPCPIPGQPFYGQDAQYDGPQPAYKDNENGTVTDLNTNLMWEQVDDGIVRNWQEALDYCESLVLLSVGYSDWRLPNRRELMSIVNYNYIRFTPTIDTEYFPNCRSFDYWSSSTYCYNPNNAWIVNFYTGIVDEDDKISRYNNVRCVRGGP